MALAEDKTAWRPRKGPAFWLLEAILVISGGWMTGGGIYLFSLGGSPYYMVAGLAVLFSAWLVWRGDRRGAWAYGAMLGATTLWALWESWLDPWALAPRLIGPFAVGLLFLLPGVQRLLKPQAQQQRRRAIFAAAAAAVAALATAAVLASGDPASGVLPAATALRDATGAGMPDGDWQSYGRTAGGTRFSPLVQITPANVDRLKVAWTHRFGVLPPAPSPVLEVTPIKVGDTLYACSPDSVVTAIDAETGKARWRFDPKTNRYRLLAMTCRGVSYYRNVAAAQGSTCAAHILALTPDARLIALDAADGKPCGDFGEGGAVDLWTGMGKRIPGYYSQTSAPTIVRGKIIVGGYVLDNQMLDEPSGVVRAFDALTGDLAWAWDLGKVEANAPLKPGEHYTPGTPNVWAPASADEALGLVYLPTGNATPDFWGGRRTAAMDRYSSSVVALDAQTGRVRWSFQTVHHDVWDYDVASQPTLTNLPINGRIVPALIQPTKRGEIFVLDRRTGKPLSPVIERPVPPGLPAPGDRLSPTQPWPAAIPSANGPKLTETMMWGATPLDQLWCRIKFREARYDGVFTPPGTDPFIFYPGYSGGSNWGGVSIDPERMVMIVNTTRFAQYGRLLPRAEADRRGLRPFRGLSNEPFSERVMGKPQIGTPFAMDMGPFMSPLGMPCQQPPFGTITAIDLRAQRVLWTKPLGTARNSGPMGLETRLPLPLGTPNQGGSVVTRSGLVFIGATQERVLRAYELATGKLLWKADLPAGANANPMIYRAPSGREFVVVAAGGNAVLGGPSGDYLIAYALPR
ncbi:membrane-bound PQQ-dependent dehydrogenase, glucose/quinate/shikimate family [Sphingobium sp. H39-3-25]|uniref:membrane-bound PQQ-dependent dehydrogenase, glucose/quinate/shikimate family n=1 Tax=Sphingobium arseniciresistens TaxID=3030834 RepID=UPI0023B8C227|nr:membrane-bound PQQ-dependent dehydrogenase, glucose/quinate/shikimate family [Sphingobium arseniciresistens]